MLNHKLVHLMVLMVAITFLWSSAAMGLEKRKIRDMKKPAVTTKPAVITKPKVAAKVLKPTLVERAKLVAPIKFIKISVNNTESDAVVAYKTPWSIRLACAFIVTDATVLNPRRHSISFYINNLRVYKRHGILVTSQATLLEIKDVDMLTKGNYIFKCVIDDQTKSMPFKVADYYCETCRPIVTVHFPPSLKMLEGDIPVPPTSPWPNPNISLNVSAPDQILHLTSSAIVFNSMVCKYGTALTYMRPCKQGKKVPNQQHKYECMP